MPRTARLRTRLIIWFTLISLLLYLAAAAIIVGLGMVNTRRDLGYLLYAQAESLAGYFAATGELDFPELQADNDSHSPFRVWVRLVENDVVLAQTDGFPGPVTPAVKTQQEGRLEVIQVPGVGEVAAVRHSVWGRSGSYAEARAPLALFHRTTSQLGWVLLATPLLLVPLGISGAWFLARRTVGPIEALVGTLQKMDSNALDQRLPVFGQIGELDDLTDSFNTLLDRLQESVGRMRRFTADASHEMRTPVSILRTGFEVALRKERSAAEYRVLLADSLLEIERVQRVVEGLLALAREESAVDQAVPSAPVSLSLVARAAMGSLATLAAERRVLLKASIEPEIQVYGHEDRLRLVVINLLDNAIRHSPEGSQVWLSLKRVGARAELVVEDEGMGISEADRPRIFERFFRSGSDASSSSVGGLGLSVVHWVVQQHDGQVRLGESKGPGARFEVLLPAC